MTALEMDPAIRARWVAALRSGEYEQAWGVLRDDAGGRCCLGVLCDLAVEDGVIPPADRNALDGSWLYAGEDTELPPVVRDWAGLRMCNPVPGIDECDGDGNPASLAELNDGSDERQGWTFAQIADVIEGGAS